MSKEPRVSFSNVKQRHYALQHLVWLHARDIEHKMSPSMTLPVPLGMESLPGVIMSLSFNHYNGVWSEAYQKST